MIQFYFHCSKISSFKYFLSYNMNRMYSDTFYCKQQCFCWFLIFLFPEGGVLKVSIDVGSDGCDDCRLEIGIHNPKVIIWHIVMLWWYHVTFQETFFRDKRCQFSSTSKKGIRNVTFNRILTIGTKTGYWQYHCISYLVCFTTIPSTR